MVSHERIYQYIRDDKAAGGHYYNHLAINSNIEKDL